MPIRLPRFAVLSRLRRPSAAGVRAFLAIAGLVAGVALIVAGVALVFAPAALVVAGVALLLVVAFDPDAAERLRWPR
jgi:hypothetical protein